MCNFHWAADPCEDEDEEEEEDVEEDETDEFGDTFVVVAPSFTFQCTSPGLFAHDSDCSRFWLCRYSSLGRGGRLAKSGHFSVSAYYAL